MAVEIDHEYVEMKNILDKVGLEIQRIERDSNNERLYVIRKKK